MVGQEGKDVDHSGSIEQGRACSSWGHCCAAKVLRGMADSQLLEAGTEESVPIEGEAGTEEVVWHAWGRWTFFNMAVI